MLPFSGMHESFNNRHEKDFLKKDIEAYQQMKEGIETKGAEALQHLQSEYPEAYELFEKTKDGGVTPEFKKLVEMKNSDEQLGVILATIEIQDQFNELSSLIHQYVDNVNQHEFHVKKSAGMVDVDEKDEAVRLSARRTATHNNLISTLQSIMRLSAEVGIDTLWSSVVGFSDSQVYRQEVQRWAEHVADYFVSLSETTH